jgi:hypothetical protein
MQELKDIEQTEDLVERALKLAAVVTRIFSEEGWDLVVVGGSAVEFYTEGAYMSGDIDLCRRTPNPIPLRRAQELMGQLGAVGGPRSWKVAGLYVDLLGLLENEALSACRDIDTPYGKVVLAPAELILVERVLLCFYPNVDAEARDVAKKMMAVCLTGKTPVDWDEVERLAGIPAFGIAEELAQLRDEVANELKITG